MLYSCFQFREEMIKNKDNAFTQHLGLVFDQLQAKIQPNMNDHIKYVRTNEVRFVVNAQADAHEFFDDLIDRINQHESKLGDKFFKYVERNRYTCLNCHHQSEIKSNEYANENNIISIYANQNMDY